MPCISVRGQKKGVSFLDFHGELCCGLMKLWELPRFLSVGVDPTRKDRIPP